MASEQFSLCWDNFHKNMSSGMNSLLENEDLVDVTLAVQGKCLKAHKMVLSVCSPYFKELFKSNPCQHPIVFMKDVSYEALSDLLQFMYQGEVQVSQENLTTFIKTAEALQIKGLTGDGNGSTENDTTDNSQEKIVHQIEEYKPPPRPKKQPPPTPVATSPQTKRPRLSSTSTNNESHHPIIPSPITKTEPVSSAAVSNVTETAAPVQFKMEPYDQTHSLIDETGDETFGDDTLDDNTVDDTEDYSMMEGGVGEEEPQAGTSTDGAGEGQGSEKWSTINRARQFNSNVHLRDIETILHFCTRILGYVVDIDTKITRLGNKNDTSRWSIFRKMLPCNSLEQIAVLNSSLEIQNNETAFRDFIASFGGQNARDKVVRVMKTLFTNEFATKCSWLGRRDNIRVSNLKCIEIAKDALLTSIKENEFETFASDWLRFAKLRFMRGQK